jgi:hypothetical protein
MDRLSGDQGYAAAFGGSATLRWLVEIAVWVLAGGQGKNHHNQDSSAAADPATASQGRPPHPGASSTEPGPRSVRAPRSRTAIGAPTVPKGSEEPQATLPPGQAAGRIRAGDADSGPEDHRTSRAALRCRRPGFVDGRGSRPAAGRTPRAGAAFQLHQAPDPGAVGADVRLDLGGQLADGGQVDAEQLRAPLQRRRDRPAQVRVVPGPTPTGNRTGVRNRIGNPAYRTGRAAGAHWGHRAPACVGQQRTVLVRE